MDEIRQPSVSEESAPETAQPAYREANGGRLLLGGKPGNKGGGRTPDEFKQLCRELVDREATRKAVDEILADKKHPMFLGALKWATEYGYGKPKETIEVLDTREVPNLSDEEIAKRRQQLRIA